MTTRITVRNLPDGTQLWVNRDEEADDALRYIFVPKAQLSPGDRVEDMRVFERSDDGKGKGRRARLRKRVEQGFNLSTPIINALPNGSFLRMREAP